MSLNAGVEETLCGLNRHQVGFFFRQHLIDIGDVAIRQLLHVINGAPFFVLGDRFFLT